MRAPDTIVFRALNFVFICLVAFLSLRPASSSRVLVVYADRAFLRE